MDTKANLANRKKINELAIQHNKLTTLVGCLLNEINSIKKELNETKNGDRISNRSTNESSNSNIKQGGNSKFPNFNDLRAEDILKQLSINNIDN
jgi:hypothetical protein